MYVVCKVVPVDAILFVQSSRFIRQRLTEFPWPVIAAFLLYDFISIFPSPHCMILRHNVIAALRGDYRIRELITKSYLLQVTIY